MTRRVRIFDTSLRDGEQAPGMGMGPEAKFSIARALVDLGVDVIEAGFAASSELDAVSLRRIAHAFGSDTTIASLARAVPGDVTAAAESLELADRARIHVFVPSSDLHIEAKLGSSREAVLASALAGIATARRYVDDVQLGLEDASRADRDYLAELVRAGISAGASTVAVADTVGYLLPAEAAELVTDLYRRVPELDSVALSVHCHDDLGMAVANTLAAVAAGADQVECTVNGIGERAGNAALEEIVMALKVRSAALDCVTSVRTSLLCSTSRLLAGTVGLEVPPNKAVVGRNAFAHEAGIHQHGVLRNPLTYEIMTPASVGAGSAGLVFGRHSGRHALVALARQHGLLLSPAEIDEVFSRVKAEAAHRSGIAAGDVLAWCSQVAAQSSAP